MVHRVVRHVEVWSVVKMATAFAICGYIIGMISGYLLWRAADRVGTIDGIEGFLQDSGGYDGGFEILGGVVFVSTAIGFAILSMLFVAMATLGAVLFNLISDLTGGIRMTAIDEDLIVTPARRPAPNAPQRSAPPETVGDDVPSPAPAPTPTPAPAAVPTALPATTTKDPWKMPAPNETWTSAAGESTNGDAVASEPPSESIGLGTADRVV